MCRNESGRVPRTTCLQDTEPQTKVLTSLCRDARVETLVMSVRSDRETDPEALIEPFLEGAAGRRPPTHAIVCSLLLSLLGGLSFFVPWWFAFSVVLFAPAVVLVLRPATHETANGLRRMARVALGLAAIGVGLWLVSLVALLLRFPESAPKLLGVLLLLLMMEGLAWGSLRR